MGFPTVATIDSRPVPLSIVGTVEERAARMSAWRSTGD
jgi:hypothetical protein